MKKIIFRCICVLSALSVIGAVFVIIDYCNNEISAQEYRIGGSDDNKNAFDSNKNNIADTKEDTILNK